MYRSVDVIKDYVSRKDIYRPFILCEYLHAMGNSCGGMKEYWDVFESEPMAQVVVFGIGSISRSVKSTRMVSGIGLMVVITVRKIFPVLVISAVTDL